MLWVWGDGEWMRKWFKTGEEDLAERRAAYRNLTEVRLADCGHMLHHEQPERLAEVLEGFLAEPELIRLSRRGAETQRHAENSIERSCCNRNPASRRRPVIGSATGSRTFCRL